MNSRPADRDREMVSSLIPQEFSHVFPFSHFNHVQSQCLTSFQTNNNLVVSAPTGSGKTILFELAICRELHHRNSTAGSAAMMGKIVYLAPIKALCAEKAAEWTAKFEPLGLTVCVLSGNEFKSSGASQARLLNADIILSTPEKLDSVTRNHNGTIGQSFVATVSLICIDEIHHLADSRGAALEAVVARMLLCSDELKRAADRNLNGMPATRLRIIAASATIPNLAQVAAWLRVPDGEHCKAFSEAYRSVPLEQKVLGFTTRNQWKFNEYLSSRCFQVVMQYSSKKPSLVFCPSRKSCFSAAKQFLVDMHKRGPATTVHQGNAVTQPLTFSERSQLMDSASQCGDKTIGELIRHGVAVHHAAVSDEDRELVEHLFRKRLIRVLFATTTLSMGCNLPARLVVVLGTTVYQQGKLTEIDQNMIVQMVGRAGRPQYDTKGVAVIMTGVKNVQLYERLCAGKHGMVNSQLEPQLAEHFNAEISRGTVNSVSDALLWLKSTFLYAQKKQIMRPQALEKATKEVVLNIVAALAEYALIEYNDASSGIIKPLNASRLMAHYYISFATMKVFIAEGEGATSGADLLRILGKSTEITESLFLRRSEKKQLNEISLLLRHPLRSKVSTVQEKVYLLLQCNMAVNGSEFVAKDFNLGAEMRTIGHTAKRLAITLARFLLERERPASFTSSMAALEVSRGIEAGVWWNGGGVVQQLKGIGPQAAKKLIGGGVSSFRTLARMDPRIIEQLLKKNVPFGNELQRQLQTLPRLQVQVEQIPMDQEASLQLNKVAMVFRVVVSRASWIEGKEGISNSSHRAFLLVGSHAQPIDHFEKFTLNGSQEHILTATVYAPRERSSRWIDFFAGPDEYVGCDFHHRIHVPGAANDASQSQHRPKAASGDTGPGDLQHSDVLDLTGPEPHLLEGGHPRPPTISSEQAKKSAKACKHSCKDKSRCKHICCFSEVSTPKAAPQQTVLNDSRTASAPARDSGKRLPTGCTTAQNLEELRVKARPLTSSLPLKRLRENSEPAAPSFSGTRLAAFFQQEPTEIEDAGPVRTGLKQSRAQSPKDAQVPQAKAMVREDSYDAIFSLLAEQQEEEQGTSGNLSKKFCLQRHLEEGDDADFADLTLPDTDSTYSFP